MPSGPENAVHGEEGTAAIELVAVLPFLLLAVLMAAQLALAGQALWSASLAARAGARAALVGGDAAGAARGMLPSGQRREAKVDADGAEVSVRVPVPRLLPDLPLVRVEAKAALEAADE